jgi:transcriptional regulator with XRE-family HTH domain
MSMVTSEQIKIARAALGWSIDIIAKRSEVGVRTINRIEAQNGLPRATSANFKIIRLTLEQAGVEFIGSADEEPDIRLWKR